VNTRVFGVCLLILPATFVVSAANSAHATAAGVFVSYSDDCNRIRILAKTTLSEDGNITLPSPTVSGCKSITGMMFSDDGNRLYLVYSSSNSKFGLIVDANPDSASYKSVMGYFNGNTDPNSAVGLYVAPGGYRALVTRGGNSPDYGSDYQTVIADPRRASLGTISSSRRADTYHYMRSPSVDGLTLWALSPIPAGSVNFFARLINTDAGSANFGQTLRSVELEGTGNPISIIARSDGGLHLYDTGNFLWWFGPLGHEELSVAEVDGAFKVDVPNTYISSDDELLYGVGHGTPPYLTVLNVYTGASVAKVSLGSVSATATAFRASSLIGQSGTGPEGYVDVSRSGGVHYVYRVSLAGAESSVLATSSSYTTGSAGKAVIAIRPDALF
jgi:hypothetical protein